MELVLALSEQEGRRPHPGTKSLQSGRLQLVRPEKVGVAPSGRGSGVRWAVAVSGGGGVV